jgi:hypothetical protein
MRFNWVGIWKEKVLDCIDKMYSNYEGTKEEKVRVYIEIFDIRSDIPVGKSILDIFGAERIWTGKLIKTSAQGVPLLTGGIYRSLNCT